MLLCMEICEELRYNFLIDSYYHLKMKLIRDG